VAITVREVAGEQYDDKGLSAYIRDYRENGFSVHLIYLELKKISSKVKNKPNC